MAKEVADNVTDVTVAKVDVLVVPMILEPVKKLELKKVEVFAGWALENDAVALLAGASADVAIDSRGASNNRVAQGGGAGENRCC